MLDQSLSNADLFALMKHCHVLLSLHRSEGLGMVMAEAALLGTPIVATGWSGVLDFLDADCAGLVGYELVSVDRLDNLTAPKGSVWAEPNLEEAADWLRRLERDEDLRRRLAAQAQARAAIVFSQSHFEEKFAIAQSTQATPGQPYARGQRNA